MTVLAAKLTIHIPWAFSLKDKRQVRRSLIDKARRKFNLSVTEVATQDIHQTLTLGLAAVAGEYSHAREVIDHAVHYMETSTEAEVVSVEMIEP